MRTLLQQIAIDAQKAFYNADFAEPVTISDGLGNSAAINGIVDLTHQEVDLETQTIVMSAKPRVSIWSPDVPFEVKQMQTVVMRGANYIIRDVEQQGDGSLILILNSSATPPQY
jgi:hypothetical protein